jgi:spore maturation protein CgeB
VTLRLFYVAMEHEYGDRSQGPSFEAMNFRSALEGMGHVVVPFDFMAVESELGRERMNRELVARARDADPDAVFFCLFEDQISTETLEAVRRATRAPTVNWFADDHWRFEAFSRQFAGHLDWCVTTDPDAVPKYRAAGHANVILSQWACNRYAYHPTDGPLAYGVTFVGQPHGNRREIVAAIQSAGVDVRCWGHGWPDGRLTHDEMVRVFGTSTINLNLSNASDPPRGLRVRVGRLLGRGGGIPHGPRPSQIKGRTFEVPGCRGFQLTEQVPHLERYFEPGREIAVYDSEQDLIRTIRYWLSHPEERQQVAEAAYRRVMAEHTYDHRFAAIFTAMDLSE